MVLHCIQRGLYGLLAGWGVLWCLLLQAPLAIAGIANIAEPACDACRFQINQLDKPFKLTGTWLFTREDRPENKDLALDTRTWQLVRAPGPWKGVYPDKQDFRVGWYRGSLHFAPSLMGQEVVLLVDPFMARVNAYVDGVEIFRRPGNINIERYYAVQPIPLRFTVTRPIHQFALRVETPLMNGIYQLPFELRRYDPHDSGLVWQQFLGGELRLVSATVAFAFGLFFLLVFRKARHGLYRLAALSSLSIVPFFIMPTDFLLRLYPPENLLVLHYLGLSFGYFLYLFSQYFHRFTPRINWIIGILFAGAYSAMVSTLTWPNLELFQAMRSLLFLLMLLSGLGATYMWMYATINRKPGAGILLVGMLIYLAGGINDLLLALGVIDSVQIEPLGMLFLMTTMLMVASNIFGNTFRHNQHLVVNLTSLNDHLEEIVDERTEELARLNEELNATNQQLRESLEELEATKDDLVRSEKLAALGSLVAGVAHELNTPIGNGLMASTTLADHLKVFQMDMAEKGLRRSKFETFLDSVKTAVDISIRSLRRSAELVTSFKQLAVDRTSANRRRFKPGEVIDDVLCVLRPTLNRTPYQIETAIHCDQTMDSFPGALGQVLTNLINNAVIHGFDGRAHGLIQILLNPAAPGYIELRIRDDGVGIPSASLPRIFDPFFTTKLGQGGSGLGLHICYSAVTQILGGTLTVSSAPGSGTEFTATIPLVAPAAQTEGEAQSHAQGR